MSEGRMDNTTDSGICVLCGASVYEQKYFFNHAFDKLPESIKKELNIICVLFTEEIGGIFTIGFDEDGELVLSTQADEEDILYDEIGSGLMVKEIQNSRQELFESLSMFYKLMVKGEV